MFSTRIACVTDLSAICSLADQINRQHWRAHPDIFVNPDHLGNAAVADQQSAATARLSQHSAFWQQQIDAPDSTLVVALHAELVVGFITVKILPATEIPFLAARQVCRIGTIVIDASMQARGIGTALMTAAEDWARQRDVVEMRLEVFDFNRDATRFYDHAGFAVQSHIMAKALH